MRFSAILLSCSLRSDAKRKISSSLAGNSLAIAWGGCGAACTVLEPALALQESQTASDKQSRSIWK